MATRSTRDARSARREALRQSLKDHKAINGRITKASSKSKTAKVASIPRNASRAKASAKSIETPTESPTKNSLEKVSETPTEIPTEIPTESPVEELASKPFEESDVAEPSNIPIVTPISPPQTNPPAETCADPELSGASMPLTPAISDSDDGLFDFSEGLQPVMSDDELESYLHEFEAVSNGADVPESAVPDVSSIPLSPVLESSESMESKPTSPLSLVADDAFDEYKEPASAEELKIEEYLNCTNDESEPSMEAAYSTKRRVPFCIYRNRDDSCRLVSSSFNPTKRTLIAAWQTMASDVQYSTREAYFQSVLLAAASLNQRSLLSGRARETMAPALGTSH